MGRFIGWIGPVVYMATALMVVAGFLVYIACPNPLMLLGAGHITNLHVALAVIWFVAILWFIWQAAVYHEGLEDERWTAHMLAVGLVSRIVLAPIGIFRTTSAALWAGIAIEAGPGTYPGLATNVLQTFVMGSFTMVPAVLYQVCGATRLANRGLLGSTSLVCNVILAFFPTLGLVAMCGLYVNGREGLIASHDRRIVDEALAQE